MTDRKHRQDPFRLALQGLSAAALKKMAHMYKKRLGDAEERDELVNVLASAMKPDEKLDAMRRFLLAGRGSMSVFEFDGFPGKLEAEVNFDKASKTPKIVNIGKPGEINEGLVHVQWAMVTGRNSYTDTELQLQVDDKAEIVDSFYDPKGDLLQVRAGASEASRVAEAWANIHELEPEKSIVRLGLNDLTHFHAFVEFIDGAVIKAKGVKLKSKGFDKVSGEVHPSFPDLRKTPDYEDFIKEVHVTDGRCSFTYKTETIKLGFGFDSRTTVFQNLVHEDVYQHVYGKLRKFLNR